MKPLRRKKQYQVTHDPVTGQDRILNFTEEEDILSDQGSVDSAGYQRKYFLDCGCDAEIGGRCFDCGAISCKTHYGHCQGCQKPICMQHSSFIESDGQRIRLCGRCYNTVTRKQKLAKVSRFFLSIFFQPEEK